MCTTRERKKHTNTKICWGALQGALIALCKKSIPGALQGAQNLCVPNLWVFFFHLSISKRPYIDGRGPYQALTKCTYKLLISAISLLIALISSL